MAHALISGPEHVNSAIAHIKLGRALLRQQRYREAEEHTLAGYQILSKLANPSVTWLQSARKDLTAIYDALQEHEKAKKFLAERLAVASSASLASKK